MRRSFFRVGCEVILVISFLLEYETSVSQSIHHDIIIELVGTMATFVLCWICFKESMRFISVNTYSSVSVNWSAGFCRNLMELFLYYPLFICLQ